MKEITRNSNKAITMKDVADSLGVSTATVSYVINGTAPISDEIKAKVFDAIDKLNYKPNALARGLRVNKTRVIGLFVPDITIEFYYFFAKGFIDEAYKKGYTVLLCDTQYNFEREKLEVDTLLEQRVDGFVFVGGVNDESLIKSLIDRKTPVILADRDIEDIETLTVKFDNYSLMRELIYFIKDKGYKKIGYISEPLTMTNLVQRFEGFKKGLQENGLEYDEKYVIFDDNLQLNKIDESYKMMTKLIDDENYALPDIFVTTADLIAIGVMNALKDNDISIPKQIGITGFDDALIASYSQPPLTTISQDKVVMGKSAWNLMLNILEKNETNVKSVKLEGKLVVRDSC